MSNNNKSVTESPPEKETTRITAVLLITILALQPFFIFLQTNLYTIDWSLLFVLTGEGFSEIERLVLYGVINAAVWNVAFLILCLLFKSFPPIRIAFALAPTILLFFFYDVIVDFRYEWLKGVQVPYLSPIIWLTIVGVLTYLLFRASKVTGLRRPVYIFVVTIAVIPLSQVVLFGLQAMWSNEGVDQGSGIGQDKFADAVSQQVVPTENRRNVFWIITDGYPRSDMLKATTGVDNSEFLGKLENEGFVVLPEATSNYSTTFSSVQGTIHMGYFADSKTTWPNNFTETEYFEKLYLPTSNRVYEFFSKNDYIHIHSGQKIFACSNVNADICLNEEDSSTEMELSLISRTPFVHVMSHLNLPVPSLVKKLPYPTFQEIIDFFQTRSISEPMFVEAHVLAPHPPFRFREDCTEREPSEYNASLTDWSMREFFLAHLECANKKIIELVNSLGTQYPDSIIIVQGDHGSDFNVDWGHSILKWPAEGIREKFSTLSAFRLPEQCNDMLYPSMSNANSFRVVLACLVGTEVEYLPDRSFFISTKPSVSEWGEVFEVDPHKGIVIK